MAMFPETFMGINPIDNGQLTLDEIQRCEADSKSPSGSLLY